MKFDYHYFEGKFLPVVPIKLKGKKEWVEFIAFVDTGASYCLFKADVAELLGLKLEDGEKTEMVLGDGKIIVVYLHKINVNVADKEFPAYVGFSKELGINFNIIGRRSIFEQFIVCFNETERWIGFKSLD